MSIIKWKLFHLHVEHILVEQTEHADEDDNLLLSPPIPKEENNFSKLEHPHSGQETFFSSPIFTRASNFFLHFLQMNS